MAYRRIHNLRSAKEEISLQPWQKEEIEKCANDLEYFIRNYCYIDTRDAGLQLFNLRPRQVQELKNLQEHRFIKGDWYRQAGYSVTVLAYMLWDTVFGKPIRVNVYLGEKNGRCKEEFYKVRQMYLHLPYWMQPGVKKWTKKSICLANGNGICAKVATANNVRGFAPNILFVDNFGYYTDNRALELVRTVFPTIMTSNRTHLITGCSHKFGNQTPFNLAFWKNSEKDFFVSENTWDTDTQHDQAWADDMRTKLGDFRFEREYCGKIVQDVADGSQDKETVPMHPWAKLGEMPDLIRSTRWSVAFHARNIQWNIITDHYAVSTLEHTTAEIGGRTYPAIKILVRNDESLVPSAMNLEGYVTVDLNIHARTTDNVVMATRYRCLCLKSLIKPEILVYDKSSTEQNWWNTAITLIIIDSFPITEGKSPMPELPEEDAEVRLNSLLADHTSSRRSEISNFLEAVCAP